MTFICNQRWFWRKHICRNLSRAGFLSQSMQETTSSSIFLNISLSFYMRETNHHRSKPLLVISHLWHGCIWVCFPSSHGVKSKWKIPFSTCWGQHGVAGVAPMMVPGFSSCLGRCLCGVCMLCYVFPSQNSCFPVHVRLTGDFHLLVGAICLVVFRCMSLLWWVCDLFFQLRWSGKTGLSSESHAVFCLFVCFITEIGTRWTS